MGKFNILLVDDNKNNLFVLREVLKDIPDIFIFSAENGTDALQITIKNEIHLILLDIQLPDIDGFEVARLLKKKEKTMDIPIVFVTAIFRSDENIHKGYELGAIDYIFKPVDEDMVIAKVKYYLGQFKIREKYISKIKHFNVELVNKNTELNILKDQLVISRDNWKILAKNIPSNIVLVDNLLRVKFSNDDSFKPDMNFFDLYPELKAKMRPSNISSVFNSSTKTFEFELSKNFWMNVKVLPIKDNKENVMIIITDDSIRKKHDEEMVYNNFHDQLTDLYNRRYIDENIEQIINEDNLPLSIITGDLIGLKLLNDAFGHLVGDQLIVAASNLIKETCKDGIAARWGGDEFLILLPKTNIEQVAQIVKTIQLNVENSHFHENFSMGISLGYSVINSKEDSLTAAMVQSEDRMYLNKLGNSSRFKNSVIDTLHSSLLEKDYETEQHAERMTELVKKVSTVMQLKQHEIDQLVLLTSLHDIGKITVPDSILLKEGPLTDEEWVIVKKHSEVGYRMCATIPELASISNVILSHHERWDGFGYPQGLLEKEIPFLSRIICVVDAYDVMTNRRAYKTTMTHEEAITELEDCRGTQFDPEIVDVFTTRFN